MSFSIKDPIGILPTIKIGGDDDKKQESKCNCQHKEGGNTTVNNYFMPGGQVNNNSNVNNANGQQQNQPNSLVDLLKEIVKMLETTNGTQTNNQNAKGSAFASASAQAFVA